jgi:hypothetical protein
MNRSWRESDEERALFARRARALPRAELPSLEAILAKVDAGAAPRAHVARARDGAWDQESEGAGGGRAFLAAGFAFAACAAMMMLVVRGGAAPSALDVSPDARAASAEMGRAVSSDTSGVMSIEPSHAWSEAPRDALYSAITAITSRESDTCEASIDERTGLSSCLGRFALASSDDGAGACFTPIPAIREHGPSRLCCEGEMACSVARP